MIPLLLVVLLLLRLLLLLLFVSISICNQLIQHTTKLSIQIQYC